MIFISSLHLFHSESEAVRFLESVEDLLFQKEKIDSDSSPKGQSEDSLFKKPKLLRKLTKKDISAPCNFKHVSGIMDWVEEAIALGGKIEFRERRKCFKAIILMPQVPVRVLGLLMCMSTF